MPPKRKTSLRNVKSFIENVNDTKKLVQLQTMLSQRLEKLSNSEGSDDSSVSAKSTVLFSDEDDCKSDAPPVVSNSNVDTVIVADDKKEVDDDKTVVEDNVVDIDVSSVVDDLVDNNRDNDIENKDDHGVICPAIIDDGGEIESGKSDVDDAHANISTVAVDSDVAKYPKPIEQHIDNFVTQEISNQFKDFFGRYSFSYSERGHKVAAFGVPYHYNGAKHPQEYKDFPDIISKVINVVNDQLPSNKTISSGVVNEYEGPESFISEHADNESVIDSESLIHTISFGDESTVQFRNTVTGEEESICVKNGSLYSMSYTSQSIWKHRVDKREDFTGKRWALSLRVISTDTTLPTSPPSRSVGGQIKHIIVGDSLMRHIKGGRDSVTFFKGGAKIADIVPLLDHNFKTKNFDDIFLSKVKSITLSVGTNDLTNHMPVHVILSKYCELLEYLKRKLPNARILLFNIPPRYYPSIDLLFRIRAFNNSLLDLTNFYDVEVIQLFWEFIDCYGYMVGQFYKRDFLHFSEAGISLVEKSIMEYQNIHYL